MNKKSVSILFLSVFILVSCNDDVEKSTSSASSKKEMVQRSVDPIQYSQGQKLFQQNCSACHGKHGEGAKNWRTPDEQGKNPAPPLNGTGHTWHHSNKALINVIRNGTAKIGGNMPAWKDNLSDREIKLILTWIKAQWPDELYTAWYNRFYQK